MSARKTSILTGIATLRTVLYAEQTAAAQKLKRNIGRSVDKADAIGALHVTKTGNGSASFVRLLPSHALKETKKIEGMLKRLSKLESDVLSGKEIAPYEPKPENMAKLHVYGVGERLIDASEYRSLRFIAGNRESEDARIVNGAPFDALCRGMENAGIVVGATFTLDRPQAVNAVTGKVRERETFTFKAIIDGETVKGYTVTTPLHSEPENAQEYAERMEDEAQAALNAMQAEREAQAETTVGAVETATVEA